MKDSFNLKHDSPKIHMTDSGIGGRFPVFLALGGAVILTHKCPTHKGENSSFL